MRERERQGGGGNRSRVEVDRTWTVQTKRRQNRHAQHEDVLHNLHFLEEVALNVAVVLGQHLCTRRSVRDREKARATVRKSASYSACERGMRRLRT